MRKILAFAVLAALILLVSCDRKSPIEKKIDRILSSMSLEEKIGQMVQLEINQIAYYDPQYDFRELIKMGPEKLEEVIREGGLQKRYNASKMFQELDIANLATVYPFYALNLDLCAKDGFALDTVKMQNVFGEYHVGSILNMLGGTEASELSLWQSATSEIKDASVKYNGIPVIYGLDHVHGPTYIIGGTMYPQQIGLAATFNPALVKELGKMNAYETRAGGIPWCFGPSMDLGVQPAWSRFYETWGEDPYLTAVMAGSYMQGLMGPDPNHIDAYHVAPCLKHYFGYSAPDNGVDRTPATITPQDLREKHFYPFEQAALAGAPSVMTNSSVVNGIPGVCNKELITGWLKEGLDWDGVAVTDWADIQELGRLMKASPDVKTSIGLAINAGIDMMMVPSELTYGPLLKELVDEGVVPVSRIDDAVRRILRLKARVGLLDSAPEEAEYPLFGSPKFAAKAYQAAVESEVLLKNQDATLPLPKNARILLCGPNANTMRGLSGGWTYTHQGSKTEHISAPYNTILEAMQARFPGLIYEPGVEYDEDGLWYEEKQPQISKAVAAASRTDYIVCCIGENSYAETQGSIRDINLSGNQKDLVKALAATGKPIILVLNEGRPRVIHDIEPLARAIVCVMLPSNYGGDALAALLAGDENFSGRLPFTYPAFPNGITSYSYKVMEDRSTTPGIYNYSNNTMAEWWFGEGLSYTTFEYGELTVDMAEFGADDTLRFTVNVTNTGDRSGKETVLLYVSDDIASLMPDNRRLRAFSKVELQPGETSAVQLDVPARDLAFVGLDGKRHLEAGSFTVLAGGQFLKVQCTETSVF